MSQPDNQPDVSAQFPTHTAEPAYLPPENVRAAAIVSLKLSSASEPVEVWVQTLNSIHRQDAERETHYSCAMECQSIRKGKQIYTAFAEDFVGMTTQARVEFLVNHEMSTGRVSMEAAVKYKYPLRPERDEKDTEESYVGKIGKYSDEVDKILKLRAKHIEALKKKYTTEWSELPVQRQVDNCMAAWQEVTYQNLYQNFIRVHTIYRAVRTSEDHLRRYFKSPEQVADLDDAVLEDLVEIYSRLNSVRADEIPT